MVLTSIDPVPEPVISRRKHSVSRPRLTIMIMTMTMTMTTTTTTTTRGTTIIIIIMIMSRFASSRIEHRMPGRTA